MYFIFFIENPQTEKEENLPTIETQEISPKASQDNIENVDSHSRSNEEKTSLTSENVLDEVKVISENIEENTPAAIELSETVKQTAIENPIDEKSIEVEQTGKKNVLLAYYSSIKMYTSLPSVI